MKFTEKQLQRAIAAIRRADSTYEGDIDHDSDRWLRHLATEMLSTIEPFAPTTENRNLAVRAAKKFVGASDYASGVVVEAAVDAALGALARGLELDTEPCPPPGGDPLSAAELTVSQWERAFGLGGQS